jgi:hypothetical protein
MKIKKYFTIKFLLTVAVLSMAFPLAISAQKSKKSEDFAGKIKFTGTVVTFNGRSQGFTLDIKGLTSDSDVKSDLDALKSKGQDGFQEAIEKQDLGYFALDGQIGQNLKFVTETKTDEGTKIVAVFERWLQPFELRYGTRSTDYPFTYIEIFIDNNGKGSGMAIGAARLQIDKNNPNSLEFENFGTFPAKLIGVQMSNKNSMEE